MQSDLVKDRMKIEEENTDDRQMSCAQGNRKV